MNKNNGTDERDLQNFGMASIWAVLLFYFYTILKLIYYLGFSDVQDYGFLWWDIVLVIIVGLVIAIILYRRKTFLVPEMMSGKSASTGEDKPSRLERILKSYLPKALLYGLIYAIVRYFMHDNKDLLRFVFEWLFFGLIVFVAQFAIGEFMVKRHNKSLEE